MQQKTNAYGVVSLTLSIFSVIFSSCSCIGLFFGIPALILGIIGAQKKDMGTGTAIAGIVISIVGCIISGYIIFIFGLIGGTTKAISNLFS